MIPFNKEMHDNLIALGYERYERYVDSKGEQTDMYWHLDNDDWFGIDQQGHIDPMDLCEYTEGSVKGRRIYQEWLNNGNSRAIQFTDKEILGATLSFTQARIRQKNLPYELEKTADTARLTKLTEH